ncbi:CPBP family intramembrane metalloprotease [Clostridium sp. CS001]|uniref:CPBP family intramembrane glutamic endopeptidase n=1 Tax=Clostridium sp. CS001 TaxID=2880648 RepID=UPI001CF2C2F3|nr:type II CAAX endopeptidase family protein [Clostridium sp. CS001]MCB2291450.1 CPBP family intramembrane metalloprotease [Clostridium sp. CS001]
MALRCENLNQEKSKKDFSITYCFTISILLIFINLSIDIIIRIFMGSSNMTNPYIRGFINSMADIVIIIYVCRKKEFTIINLFSFKNNNRISIIAILLVIIGFRIIFSEVSNILEFIIPRSNESYNYNNCIFGGKISLLGSVLYVGVFAPILEEILYRGVILTGLLRNYSKKVSVIVSSLIFAAMHFNIYILITAFIMGLFLSWIRLQGDSIIECIIAHSVYNLLPRILSYIFNIKIKGFNTDIGNVVQFQPLWFIILGFNFLLLGVVILKNYSKNKHILDSTNNINTQI